jgi:hypothetical protein
MKVSRERMKLCSDVANSAQIELQRDLERRREKAIQRGMDKVFLYTLLSVSSVVLIVEIVTFLKDIL